jgi:predicted nucleic acid-binding protein
VAILLDTSALVDALTGDKHSGPAVQRAHDRGERVILSSLVLYEWLRGPRLAEELAEQEELFPQASARVFGPAEATQAAALYRVVPRARGRETDIAIAACALVWDARLWTLNLDDFRDIPGLVVQRPA